MRRRPPVIVIPVVGVAIVLALPVWVAAPKAWAQALPEIVEEESANEPVGYTPADTAAATASPASTLVLTGYVDVGFVNAQGDGTSFAPGDTRLPADYGVDPFATAVNSRGDAASTASGGRFVNGFLPYSAGVGGRPSFLINTINVDVRFTAPTAPVMVFTRLQLVPRAGGDAGNDLDGDGTRVVAEQAFGRITPFESTELALAVGKFDSVFGIEYLENQANLRTGITPSLIARYTTGQSIGAKLFYRLQIAPLWSALSLNAAATTSGTMVTSLQTPHASLTGVPVGSARLGYELNLPRVQVKAGASGLVGPRNDQADADSLQRAWGVDVRVHWFGLAFSGEYLVLDQDRGAGPKRTGLGQFPLPSAFHVEGFYAQLAYGRDVTLGPLRRATVYARGEQRHARFEGFTPVKVRRLTAGLRLDLWDSLALKGEVLMNREVEGAPTVENDVYATSVVWTW